MADSDRSITNLRYNQVTQGMEGFGGGSPMWTPLTLVADGGINQLHGDATAGPGVGNQALTLATVNSNVGSFTSANITVDAKGRITAAANGSSGSSTGRILQVVSFSDASGFSTTSSSFTAGSTAVTITPTASSSKIRISITGSLGVPPGTTGDASATVGRDGSSLTSTSSLIYMANLQSATVTQIMPATLFFYDSPATTSPVSYSVMIANSDGATPVVWGITTAPEIIVEEISQ